MEVYKLHLTEDAEKDLAALDPVVATRIADKLKWFTAQENPLHFAVRLTGFWGKYRFRIGDYRAIFRIDNHGAIIILIILRVKHRREVYD